MSLIPDYVNPKTLKENPWSRKLFPELRGKQYDLLKDDIDRNGIMVPIEVNGNNVILKGHERCRVAIELGLKKVPVVVFENQGWSDEIYEAWQHVRIVTDNLARKAVDKETRLRGFFALKQCFGIIRGQLAKTKPRTEKGTFAPVVSADTSGKDKLTNEETEVVNVNPPILTDEEIAKETGVSKETYYRAKRIQESTLPEKVKEAILEGELPIRPVAEILDLPKNEQTKVVEELEKQLTENKGRKIQVTPIVRAKTQSGTLMCPVISPIEGKAKDEEWSPTLDVKCPKCGHKFDVRRGVITNDEN